jgi:hypothetical protein
MYWHCRQAPCSRANAPKPVHWCTEKCTTAPPPAIEASTASERGRPHGRRLASPPLTTGRGAGACGGASGATSTPCSRANAEGRKLLSGHPLFSGNAVPGAGPPERVGRDSLGPMLPRPTRLVSASGRRPFAKLKQKARRLIARRASKAGSSGARIADATQTKLRLHTATKPGRQLWPTREGGALLMAAAVLSRS